MAASVVGWRAACAAWGEPARPGLPRRGNGKGAIKFLLPQADSGLPKLCQWSMPWRSLIFG